MKTKYIVKRYMDILGRLSNGKKAKFEQLVAVIESTDEQLKITQRTLQRVIQDIQEIFRIVIRSDREGFYYIVTDDSEEDQLRMMQTLQFVNYQKHIEGFEKYVSYDTQCMVGQQYIYDIKTAIKERTSIEIVYDKYALDKENEIRSIEPYGLKEYRGRWYLVGNDRAKNEIRTFGLDRIRQLQFSNSRFTMPRNFSVKSHFQSAIGTYVLYDDVAELIEVSVSHRLAGYIRNMPIHSSQKIIKENMEGITIQFRAYVTVELVNELLIYSDDMVVHKPSRLKKRLVKRAQQILENNL